MQNLPNSIINVVQKSIFFWSYRVALIKEQNKMCICYLLIITELDNRIGPICEQIIIGRTDTLKGTKRTNDSLLSKYRNSETPFLKQHALWWCDNKRDLIWFEISRWIEQSNCHIWERERERAFVIYIYIYNFFFFFFFSPIRKWTLIQKWCIKLMCQ